VVQLRATIAHTLPIGGEGGPNGLTWDGSHLWTSCPVTDRFYRVDPADGKVAGGFPSPGTRPHGLEWRSGDLWSADTDSRTIHRIDPESGEVRAAAPSPDGTEPHGLTWADGHLWFGDERAGNLHRVALAEVAD
jgi:streptogramin lyase